MNNYEILSKHTGYSVEELHERLTEPILQPFDCAKAMDECRHFIKNGKAVVNVKRKCDNCGKEEV